MAATEMDIARAKMKRERGVTYLNGKQRIVSRSEPVLAQMVMHDKDGNMPVEWVRTFFGDERLPDFSLDHTIGVIEVVRRILAVNAKINEMEKEKEGKAD